MSLAVAGSGGRLTKSFFAGRATGSPGSRAPPGSIERCYSRGLAVIVVGNVYTDPCNRAAGTLDPELAPGVNDLATALSRQPHTQASEVTDVTLAGYSGKYLEYTFSSTDGACSRISRFPTVNGPREAIQNERDQVWILDVDGVRLMIDLFSFPGATESDIAEVREIVESIRIEL